MRMCLPMAGMPPCLRQTFCWRLRGYLFVTCPRCEGCCAARRADLAPAACAQKYQHLFQVNEAQGSFYLQSKVSFGKAIHTSKPSSMISLIPLNCYIGENLTFC